MSEEQGTNQSEKFMPRHECEQREKTQRALLDQLRISIDVNTEAVNRAFDIIEQFDNHSKTLESRVSNIENMQKLEAEERERKAREADRKSKQRFAIWTIIITIAANIDKIPAFIKWVAK